jgi:hypothetical protein
VQAEAVPLILGGGDVMAVRRRCRPFFLGGGGCRAQAQQQRPGAIRCKLFCALLAPPPWASGAR